MIPDLIFGYEVVAGGLEKGTASPLQLALAAALETHVGPRVSSADLSWVYETPNPFP